MNDAPSQSQDKFIVRLPDGMREAIRRLSEANKRSMNAEVVFALQMHLYAAGEFGLLDEDDLSEEGPKVESVSQSEVLEIVDSAVRDALEKFARATGKS